jgi:hypothetical protein
VVLLGLGELILLKSLLTHSADMEATKARKDSRPGSVTWIEGAEDISSVSEGVGVWWIVLVDDTRHDARRIKR